MKKRKVVFCDLDGTLFPELHSVDYITQEDNMAIAKFFELGHHFVIVTGRDARYSGYINEHFNQPIDYIGGNGSVIIKGEKEVYRSVIQKELIKEFINRVDQVDPNVNLILNLDDDTSAYRLKKDHRLFERMMATKALPVYEYLEKSPLGTTKMVVIADNPGHLEKIYNHLDTYDKLDLNLVQNSDHAFDVVNHGVDKWYAILKYCEMNQIDLDDIYTIGNESNDYLMIKKAPYSYAKADGIDKVKQVADKVVTSVSEAIVDILNRYES